MFERCSGARARGFLCAALVTFVALLGVSGCYSPDFSIPDCSRRCESDCFSGYECRAGYCVRRGSDAVCGNGDAGTGGSDVGGTGGATARGATGGNATDGPVASGGTANGAAGNAGGTTMDAGGIPSDAGGGRPDAGDGGTDADDVTVHAEAPTPLCSGRAVSVDLVADGSAAVYGWSLTTSASDGWTLVATGPKRARLTGTAKSAGAVALTVALTTPSGVTVERRVSIDVHETPVVDAPSWPGACSDVPYIGTLTAHGGDVGGYAWSAVAEEGTVLSASGPDVSFEPKGAGELALKARVTDGTCQSDDAAIAVAISPDSSQCPTFFVNFEAPCSGRAYDWSLPIFGGEPPFHLGTTTAPGLVVDLVVTDSPPGGALRVHGTPTGPVAVTAEVIDAGGRRARRTIDLKPRSSCFVGYLSSEGDTTDLRFVDPVLGARQVVSASLGNTPGVKDFRFSPDGGRVVYRSIPGSGVPALFVADAPAFGRSELPFDGSVLAYTWSSDARTLAVVFRNDSGYFLGGVKFSGAARAALTPVSILAPSASFDASLFWVNDDRVVFRGEHTPNEPSGVDVPYYALLGGTGFAKPVPIDQSVHAPAAALAFRPASGGFFITDPLQSSLQFVRFAAQPAVYRFGGGAPDPGAGLFVASVAKGRLDVYRTVGDLTLPNTPSWQSIDGCSSLLTWAEGRERIACEGPVAEGGTGLRYFSIDPASDAAPLAAHDVTGITGYVAGRAVAHRRSFSRSGRYLAVTTGQTLYVADLDANHPAVRVDPRIDFSSSTFTEVLFSPDEKLLLRQDGTTLTLHDLRDVTNFQQLVPRGAQAPATDCVEKFVDGPEHWCGSAGASGRITWSSDSRFALGRAPSGDLIAWDFAAVSGSSISATSLCSASCTDAFAFQP